MGNSRLVYSTETGRVCPQCSQPKKKCRCKQKKQKAPPSPTGYPDDGIVRIRREVKGRGGKTVTTVFGVPLEGPALKQFAKVLKQRCGSGGSIKAGVIVIQGDHRETLAREIQAQGFQVKIAGG
jgi:translation initiation factor 1